jgi:hypothetical protein
MNRAWIPAGALASLSVAGLLALGPLTDSMGTSVAFPESVDAPSPAAQNTTARPVSLDIQIAGVTDTAAFRSRGDEATRIKTTNDDTGFVGARSSTKKSSVRTTTKSTTKAPAKSTTKKTVTKRQLSIEAIGETNSTSGLTGVSGTGTDVGEQAPTPASDTP